MRRTGEGKAAFMVSLADYIVKNKNNTVRVEIGMEVGLDVATGVRRLTGTGSDTCLNVNIEVDDIMTLQ